MSSAAHPAVQFPVLDHAEERVRRDATPAPGRSRRPLGIGVAGTLIFVAAVTLLSQLAFPAWVASTFGWYW